MRQLPLETTRRCARCPMLWLQSTGSWEPRCSHSRQDFDQSLQRFHTFQTNQIGSTPTPYRDTGNQLVSKKSLFFVPSAMNRADQRGRGTIPFYFCVTFASALLLEVLRLGDGYRSAGHGGFVTGACGHENAGAGLMWIGECRCSIV